LPKLGRGYLSRINNQHTEWQHWASGKRDSKAYVQHNKSSYILVPYQTEGYRRITKFTSFSCRS